MPEMVNGILPQFTSHSDGFLYYPADMINAEADVGFQYSVNYAHE